MNRRGPAVLLMTAVVLTGAAAVVLGQGTRPRSQGEVAQEFQALVGGLGFGPALEPSGCAFAFDPRLAHHCTLDSGPIPGGAAFCPQHACSVFDYPPLGP